MNNEKLSVCHLSSFRFSLLAGEGTLMNNRLVKELATVLRRKRSSLLLQEIAASQSEAETTLDDRESELEESAQKDRMTRLESRLTERGQVLLRQIDGEDLPVAAMGTEDVIVGREREGHADRGTLHRVCNRDRETTADAGDEWRRRAYAI